MAALAAHAGHVAAAQVRLEAARLEAAHLEAEYTATLAGLPIGRGTWAIEIAEDQYTAAASGATSGLLRIFTGARGASASRGSFSGDQTMPTNYVATIDYERGKIDDVRMALVGGTVKDLFADPPLYPHPDRLSGR